MLHTAVLCNTLVIQRSSLCGKFRFDEDMWDTQNGISVSTRKGQVFPLLFIFSLFLMRIQWEVAGKYFKPWSHFSSPPKSTNWVSRKRRKDLHGLWKRKQNSILHYQELIIMINWEMKAAEEPTTPSVHHSLPLCVIFLLICCSVLDLVPPSNACLNPLWIDLYTSFAFMNLPWLLDM